jgi:hypothetical protein
MVIFPRDVGCCVGPYARYPEGWDHTAPRPAPPATPAKLYSFELDTFQKKSIEAGPWPSLTTQNYVACRHFAPKSVSSAGTSHLNVSSWQAIRTQTVWSAGTSRIECVEGRHIAPNNVWSNGPSHRNRVERRHFATQTVWCAYLGHTRRLTIYS